MDRETFVNIRMQDVSIKDKVLSEKTKLVFQCKKCNGSGFINEGRYCQCMLEFSDRYSIIISGAPMEALDVRELVKDGRKLEDPFCKRVLLSVDQHEIEDINNKLYLYKQVIKPYLNNIDAASEKGESLLMFGGNSRGKTWALYFILVFLAKFKKKCSILYMNLKDLFLTINDAYYSSTATYEGASHHKQSMELLQIIRDVDMLLIDEGSKLPKFSDNVSVQLEGLVKERIGNKKPIIMATNHTPEDFYKMFGPSVVSAFIKNVFAIHIMAGKDLRVMSMARSNSFNYIKLR